MKKAVYIVGAGLVIGGAATIYMLLSLIHI